MTAGELPAASEIGRVALRANDVERVATFYERVVGLEPLRDGGDERVLGVGETPLLVLIDDPDAPERGSAEAGLFHTAFRVPSRAALGDALARAESEWRLTGASDHRVSEALYLRDPEDNGVEIYRDRPRDEWPRDADGGVRMDTLPLSLDEVRAAANGEDDDDGGDAGGGDGRDERHDDDVDVPPGTTVGHVHLEVTDLAAARECYVDALGFRVRQRIDDSALFVAAGDYHHHVGLNTWNGRTEPPNGRGIAWFEVVVPDPLDVETVLNRCDATGLTVRRGDVAEVVDPAGIRVRVRASG